MVFSPTRILISIIALQQIYIQSILFRRSSAGENQGDVIKTLEEKDEVVDENNKMIGKQQYFALNTDKSENKQLEPINCKKVLKNLYDKASSLTSASDINEGVLFGRLMNTTKPFWLSFHNPSIDHVRGTSYAKGIYYEFGFTNIYNAILENKESGIVIDVGMNIGWYAFLSASLGHSVIAFEPIPHNHIRYCQSLYLNNMDYRNVSCYPNGVSDTHGGILTAQWYANIGEGQLKNSKTKKCDAEDGKCNQVMLTTLDTIAQHLHWFDNDESSMPIIHLLKIDVEGSEPSVIKGASKLISSKRIQNILLEYTPTRDDNIRMDDNIYIQMTTYIINAGYKLNLIANWAGEAVKRCGPKVCYSVNFDTINLISNVTERSMQIYNICVGKNSIQCANLWWGF